LQSATSRASGRSCTPSAASSRHAGLKLEPEGTLLRISDLSIRHFEVPLAEVLTGTRHGEHIHFELITSTVYTEDGFDGTG
jgi:hypothetical protein